MVINLRGRINLEKCTAVSIFCTVYLVQLCQYKKIYLVLNYIESCKWWWSWFTRLENLECLVSKQRLNKRCLWKRQLTQNQYSRANFGFKRVDPDRSAPPRLWTTPVSCARETVALRPGRPASSWGHHKSFWIRALKPLGRGGTSQRCLDPWMGGGGRYCKYYKTLRFAAYRRILVVHIRFLR